MTPVSALAVANSFIKKGMDEGKVITPMQLIKLVYLANGWYLAWKDEPLITEAIEAWKYGPVVRSVYDHVGRRGTYDIKSLITFSKASEEPKAYVADEEDQKKIIDLVWEKYGNYSGEQLSAITHISDSPWAKVSSGKNTYIPNNLIGSYYKNLSEKRQLF
jgi:uncharacterized phage-associated protein